MTCCRETGCGALGCVPARVENFKDPGLYLLFPDSEPLVLTHASIRATRDLYLSDLARLPLRVRAAAEYRPCAICPRQDAVVCSAIPTVFPLLERVDRFLSYDVITAAYRADPDPEVEEEGMLHVVETTMQRALQHVSILSLTHYCEVGQRYFKYFAGVIPFMAPMAMAERVYLNLYFDLRGDEPAIDRMVAKMREEFEVTVRCQIARLKLMCDNDAFINAFVNTHIATQFLIPELLPGLRQRHEGRTRPVGAGSLH